MFLDGNMHGLNILVAYFVLLECNPQVIVYLPIKDTFILECMTYNPTNGRYDVLFMSEKSRIKSNTWTKIRKKLKKTKSTFYTYQYDYERNKWYFEKTEKISKGYRIYIKKHKSQKLLCFEKFWIIQQF